MKIRLWFIRETALARLYCKFPPEQLEVDANEAVGTDCLWIPRSIVEHTSKRGAEHTLDLPDWFIEKANL